MSRDDTARLLDILEAIGQIRVFRTRLERDPADGELVRAAILYHLIIVGEAARALSPHAKHELAWVPWHEIIALRNLLTHEYFRVSLDHIEAVLALHLEPLESAVAEAVR